ncbi:predicted protein [Sclerotinia sclerotiorum 1980 UF-70]|uniref:Uncharacterized protein n=1 Tax=Sclerotinia sclerotiorum (strain ATCC 18683 / 1980 / Ss-1) TaxID=665079 RepID=A7EQ57_SCLS1|nr:predicted protein [Sclerotinia sclerotiorum 1980 UF-70]EDO04973.1 predicted protein [Sclerotinia sclerotiorum 1980 UF-70]
MNERDECSAVRAIRALVGVRGGTKVGTEMELDGARVRAVRVVSRATAGVNLIVGTGLGAEVEAKVGEYESYGGLVFVDLSMVSTVVTTLIPPYTYTEYTVTL